tara:strand:+ start:301 stop:477 length:177 start_codon:yes stop_codon:yes gene_type:complete
MKLNQDIFYPKENLHLDIIIENENSKKPIEKMTATLLRRIIIWDVNKNKFRNYDFVAL